MKEMDAFLQEDVGSGDITSNALIDEGMRGEASIRVNEDCILAGLEEASEVFRSLGLQVTPLASDGSRVKKGKYVLHVDGSVRSILIGERLALNFLMRMSGIATLTRSLVDRSQKVNPSVRVAATRKTTPGFRRYEKKAVVLGGGDPHRFGLDDGILIKDNHLRAVGSISEAVRRARKVSFTKSVEVEVEDLKGAEEAARAGADIILLDNMTPKQVERAVKRIKSIDDRILVEASGGITPRNVGAFAKHADVVSLGWITHSPKAVQFSLDLTPIKD